MGATSVTQTTEKEIKSILDQELNNRAVEYFYQRQLGHKAQGNDGAF
jgi:hypothetical protein